MVMKSVAAGCLLLMAVTVVTAEEMDCVDKVVADIYCLLDASNSICDGNWNRSLSFVVNLTKAFPVGPEHVQFAFGTFSSNFIHRINLGQYTDRSDFEQAVLSTVQQKKNTYTYDAINAINGRGLLTSPTSGARPDVAKILIMVTDGKSKNVTRTVAAAQALRNRDVTIIVVSVGFLNKVELEGVAGNEDTIFTVNEFNGLEAIRSQITKRVCVAKPPQREKCPLEKKADIYAVIDSSLSIGLQHYQRNGILLKKVIDNFYIEENGIKLALCLFGSSVRPQWNLSSNKTFLDEKLGSLPYMKSATYTHLGLLWVNSSGVSDVEQGARATAKQVVIVVTDGKSNNPTKTLEAAEELKKRGFTIIVFAVGSEVNQTEITSIASRPEYAVRVSNYLALEYYASLVLDIVCNNEHKSGE